MTRLTITEKGFRVLRRNVELRDQHKFVKREGRVFVVAKDSGEEIAIFNSYDEAEEVYWEPTKDYCILGMLRHPLSPLNITVVEFVEAVRSEDLLHLFCCALFGSHCFDVLAFDEDFLISRLDILATEGIQSSILNDNTMAVGCVGILKTGGAVVRTSDEVYEVEYFFTLLELLTAVFDKTDRRPIRINKAFGSRVAEVAPGVVEPVSLWLSDEQEVPITDPIPFLLNPVEIGAEFCLLDLMEWVDRHDLLCDIISSYSSCSSIRDYNDNARKPPQENDKGQCHYVQCDRHYHINNSRGRRVLNDHLVFHGFGPDPDGGSQMTSFSLSFEPVENYAHVPVKIKESVNIFLDASYSRKGNVKEPARLLARSQKQFTLLELLDCIYDEISFHGSPENQAKELDNLRAMMSEFDEMGETIQQMVDATNSKIIVWPPFIDSVGDKDVVPGFYSDLPASEWIKEPALSAKDQWIQDAKKELVVLADHWTYGWTSEIDDLTGRREELSRSDTIRKIERLSRDLLKKLKAIEEG